MIPRMIDTDLAKKAGYMKNGDKQLLLQPEVLKQLRILDEQNAVNRYSTDFTGVPGLELHNDLFERVLYYKARGVFFKLLDKYYFLPCAMLGGLDCYGRMQGCTPLPFGGTTKDKSEWIPGYNLKPVYDLADITNMTEEDKKFACVIITDYTPQISQTIIPRAEVNDSLLTVMANCIPYMNTSLVNSTGVQGMRVSSEDESASTYSASRALQVAALTGDKWVPIVSNIEFQELTGGALGRSEEFMLAMQSLDNYRLSLYGITNQGIFQKKQHLLNSEAEDKTQATGLVLKDGLDNRNNAWALVNALWGLNINTVAMNVPTTDEQTPDEETGSEEPEDVNAEPTDNKEVINNG